MGGAGADTFFANWSASSAAVSWVNNPLAVVAVNGISFSGIEALLLATGAGNDLVDNSYAGNGGSDEISTGNGNDTISAGAGNDLVDAGAQDDQLILGLGRDTLEGGSGIDKLIVDVDMTGFTSNITYGLGAVTLGYDATFNAVNAALANAPTRWQLNLSAS
ncbi:MAG: hypothetical protein RLZZ584_1142, partial [Pseudomonadota bacterium]